jgi:hypothetical protein
VDEMLAPHLAHLTISEGMVLDEWFASSEDVSLAVYEVESI